MTIYHQRLVDTASGQPFTSGDAFDVTRVVTDIPVGESLSKAWLTIKNVITDADPGVLQKMVTTSLVVGVGQITDDGADGTGAIRFDYTGAESLTLGSMSRRLYDIQIKLLGGAIATLEQGTVRLRAGVTAATT